MQGSNVASSSSIASSRVQQNNDFAGHKDDWINSNMSKSTWMLVDKNLDTEPEKLENDLTQEMPEVDTNDTQSRAQKPEPVSESPEQDYATDSESETSDSESSSDSEDLTDRTTLLPTGWFGIEGWPGMILNFVLYSPLVANHQLLQTKAHALKNPPDQKLSMNLLIRTPIDHALLIVVHVESEV